MSITTTTFKITDSKNDCLRIKVDGPFTSAETIALRNEILKCITSNFDIIYLDSIHVTEVDLSGINEVIHSNYALKQVDKKLILIYKKSSAIEKWIETTGLDRFTATASLPAHQS